jgi:uncharacterized protein YecE (DUF72 family)
MKILVGCCGFTKAMKKYMEEFTLVETQTTFYRIVRPEVAKKWRESAPTDFIFTVKAFQGITHPPSSPTWRRSNIKPTQLHGYFQPTREVMESWEKTKTICKELNAPVVVIQAPPTFTDNQENRNRVARFFSTIKRDGLTIGFEPRGWSRGSIIEVCENSRVTHVTDPFASDPLSLGGTGTIYLRLHGSPPGRKMYSYTYTDDDLRMLADKLATYDAKRIFVLFNNMSMESDAKRLLKILRA